MASPIPLSDRSGRVRRAARLATRSYRDKTGDFLVEGPQAVREALAVPDCVREVFITQQARERFPELARMPNDAGCNIVGQDVIAAISSAVRPQGVVATARHVTRGIGALHAPGLAVVAVDVRDPGNAGSLVRVADAAGADAVILAGDCVDIHNPKAVRSSAGSIFHVPLFVEPDSASALQALDDVQVLAADGAGSISLFDDELDLTRPTAWVMGNEAHGIGAAQFAQVDAVVRIPVLGRAESLNMAAAAAVCLYTTARARN